MQVLPLVPSVHTQEETVDMFYAYAKMFPLDVDNFWEA